MIRRNQAVFHPIPDPFHGQFTAVCMEMPVITATHLILVQQIDDLPALIAPVLGRIVEKDELFPIPGSLQRGFQPEKFPVKDLSVMLTAALLLKEPSPGAADGPVFVLIKIVVENKLV